jgi:hypothetical protein
MDIIRQYPHKVDRLMNCAKKDISKHNTMTIITKPVTMTENWGT